MDNLFFELGALQHLGAGAIVGKTVRIRRPERVRIGAHSIIDDFTYISCAFTLGRFCHLGPHLTIIGGDALVRTGDFCNLSAGCKLIAASNDFRDGGLAGAAIPHPYADQAIVDDITLADHVLLGVDTVLLPGTNIPEGVATGAMTLLTSRTQLEPWTLYAGNPARKLGARNPDRIKEAADRLLRDGPGD